MKQPKGLPLHKVMFYEMGAMIQFLEIECPDTESVLVANNKSDD